MGQQAIRNMWIQINHYLDTRFSVDNHFMMEADIFSKSSHFQVPTRWPRLGSGPSAVSVTGCVTKLLHQTVITQSSLPVSCVPAQHLHQLTTKPGWGCCSSSLVITTGCPAKLFTLGYLFFCRLLLMQIAKSGTFLKNSGKLLHNRHKNLEIAEIIGVKVATFNIEFFFLPLCYSKMSISKWWLQTLTSICLSYF